MTLRYNQKNDLLTVMLGPEEYDDYEIEAGDFTITLDEEDNLQEQIVIY